MEPQTEPERTHCIRCGECCLATGPSLQKSDLPLFFNHVLDGTHLYTIRKDELVRDNINDELKFTSAQSMPGLRLLGRQQIQAGFFRTESRSRRYHQRSQPAALNFRPRIGV